MGTRSSIAVKHGDKIKAIYCHWDGYLDHNGRILLEHYNSAKANNLVALGNVSSLRENIEIPEGVEHSYEKAADDITVFFGRDRGEKDQEWRTFLSEVEWLDQYGQEFNYLMDGGVWYVSTGREFVPLHEAIEAEEEYDE